MGTYNGHKNWNHWNVSLWINNDESLYHWAQECRQTCRTLDLAAKAFLSGIGGKGSKTPDGAPYTLCAIRAAMRDM